MLDFVLRGNIALFASGEDSLASKFHFGQWCAAKCEKQALMVESSDLVFADFHGVKTPTMTESKLPTWLAKHGAVKRRVQSTHNT